MSVVPSLASTAIVCRSRTLQLGLVCGRIWNSFPLGSGSKEKACVPQGGDGCEQKGSSGLCAVRSYLEHYFSNSDLEKKHKVFVSQMRAGVYKNEILRIGGRES